VASSAIAWLRNKLMGAAKRLPATRIGTR